ncbi:hypothetical protein C1H46_038099 [Malus baccata]|uniref:Phosphorylated adapter RNA export protein n=1 Tax=Malus baccata TaxID=106549 RepID=A0A540KQT8_MALBA|nr:hypothetical protein C1H46_038099 [Malus baccata]
MEGEDNVLDAVFEDDDFMDGGDVEMLDVEEGELVDFNSQSGYGSGQGSGGNVSVANQGGQGTNLKPKPKKKKKKNKKRNNGHWTASIGTDIDRFVIETCKRLKERKSYLVYTAVGCLGIAALSDLIKETPLASTCVSEFKCHTFAMFRPCCYCYEVCEILGCLMDQLRADDAYPHYLAMQPFIMSDAQYCFPTLADFSCRSHFAPYNHVDAIQACGGQMTSDGRRFRYGGGILWNIIKSREPKAYREIMKKARDFEKQFKKPNRPAIEQRKEGSSANSSKDGTPADVPDDLPVLREMQTQANQSNPEVKHVSVRDRLRLPVSYDDDLLGGEPKDDPLNC